MVELETSYYNNRLIYSIIWKNYSIIEIQIHLKTDNDNLNNEEQFFLRCRKMRLNEKLLEMEADSSFPVFQPNPVPPGDLLILPPLTYAFYVVPEANAPACLENSNLFSNTSLFNTPRE